MERTRPVARWRHEVKIACISAAVGALISSLFAIGRDPARLPAFIVSGIVVGLAIYVSNSLLGILFEPLTARLAGRVKLAFEIVLFLVGGVCGWIAGFIVSARLFGSELRVSQVLTGRMAIFLGITALVSAVIGVLFRAFALLTERLRVREWAERELDLARELQTRLLPSSDVETPSFAVAAVNLPAHTVAGDFYDIVELENGDLFVTVADVAGKGVAASLVMASVKSVLPYLAPGGAKTVAQELNRKLCRELTKREFVAMSCALVWASTGTVELVNAGCPDAYLVRASGVETLENGGDRLPLGIRPGVEYEPLSIVLGPGERLVLLSDGLPEAPSNGEPIGYEALLRIIGNRARSDAAPRQWLEELVTELRSVTDSGLEDDWTVLVVERRA